MVKNNSFFKNIILLASGSIVAQLFNVLGAPIITRIYDVETIGIYSYIITLVGSCTAIVNLRYDLAIVSEREEERVFPIVKLSFFIGIIFSLILTIVFGIYAFWFNRELNITTDIMFFFLLLLVSNAVLNILTSYNNRMKEYKDMTIAGISRTSSQNIGGIILGYVNCSTISLLIPYAIGQFLAIKKQSSSICKCLDSIWKCDYDMMIVALKDHKKMALLSTPAMMANSFSYAAITIFIELLFGMVVVGYYSLSTRVLGLPLTLISGNVGKVFFQEAQSEYAKTRGFRKSFKKTSCLLFILSIPIGIVMYCIAPTACMYFFGGEWLVAGEYIRILTPFFICRFIGTSLSPGLLVCNKQQLELLFQFLLLCAAVCAYLLTLNTELSVSVFLWNVSIANSVVYLLLIYFVWHSSRGETC